MTSPLCQGNVEIVSVSRKVLLFHFGMTRSFPSFSLKCDRKKKKKEKKIKLALAYKCSTTLSSTKNLVEAYMPAQNV